VPAVKWHRRYLMDWNRVEGNWKQMKGKVKEKWGNLTDDDLDRVAGQRDQLEGIIQERYGIAKDQARKDVDDWFKTLPWVARRTVKPVEGPLRGGPSA
jgi:uncharacterized protein YjbJ (UPF0337 family)